MGRSCKERVCGELESRLEDLRVLWDLYLENPDASDDGLGNMYEYGLAFDYVAPDQEEQGYFCYQLSWGGPSDEFRIYADKWGYRWSVYRIEYWFMDWYDGASRRLYGEDRKLLEEIFQSFFVDSGAVDEQYDQAT